MEPHQHLVPRALASGAAASLLSTAVLALCGHLENHRPAGPVNGPSQWIYGRWAAEVRRPSLRHTLTGFLIHHAMATGWALLHERAFGARKSSQGFPARLGRAAVTATLANFVDYQLTPKRLQPGFEKQLSIGSMVAVYAAFALGLALVVRPRRGAARRPPRRE